MGDALHHKYPVHHLSTHVAGELTERSLGLQVVGRDLPFDDDLSGRRHFQIHAFAAH